MRRNRAIGHSPVTMQSAERDEEEAGAIRHSPVGLLVGGVG
jgi:hypothetical protein